VKPASPLGVLQRLRDSAPREQPRAGERCELCAEPIGDEHGHLVNVEARSLMCACRGCYLLFTVDGAGGGHFKAVPDRYVSFPGMRLTPAQWDSLQIPVSVAFFFLNSTLDRVAAFYPGPAGATESLLSLDTWQDLADAYPELGTLQPDVEAFLVRSGRDDGAECFIVPIDACYELVGRLRRLWRGFDGGREAHDALEGFFDDVRGRTR
jgi:hypothetical protein